MFSTLGVQPQAGWLWLDKSVQGFLEIASYWSAILTHIEARQILLHFSSSPTFPALNISQELRWLESYLGSCFEDDL